MKGQTEIKSAQHLKRWYSFRIFRIVWDRLVLDPSWLKSIPIPLKNWGWLRFRFQQSIAMRNRYRLRFRLTRKDWFRLRTLGSGINSVLIPYGGVHDISTPKKTSKIWINVVFGNKHGGIIARSCKNHIGGRAFWGKQATLEQWGPESVIQWRNRFRFRLWISRIDSDSDSGVK